MCLCLCVRSTTLMFLYTIRPIVRQSKYLLSFDHNQLLLLLGPLPLLQMLFTWYITIGYSLCLHLTHELLNICCWLIYFMVSGSTVFLNATYVLCIYTFRVRNCRDVPDKVNHSSNIHQFLVIRGIWIRFIRPPFDTNDSNKHILYRHHRRCCVNCAII